MELFTVDPEVYFRLVLSAVLGFIIGWDRSSKSKPAGIKTYMYVSMACALITIISIYSVDIYGSTDNSRLMDPMRLAAQIVTGLGFLGAGIILKDGLNVKGLTSASMILFVGGVGIGIGAGFYDVVILAVIIGLGFAKIGNIIEKKSILKSQEESD